MRERNAEERRLAATGRHCPSCGPSTSAHHDDHVLDAPHDRRFDAARLTRRSLLQLGAAAGATAWAARRGLSTDDERIVDLGDAQRTAAFWDPAWPPPTIVTRAEWGADESRRKSDPSYDSPIEKIVVHHAVTPNGADPEQVMRGIYAYHLSTEYIDIAYNFAIDANGRIYEGRWARDYPEGEPHTGENEAGWQARGGHALAHNTRTIGVCLLGTFTTTAPPGPMVQSLVRFLTWKCARWGIDPLGASPYENGYGDVVTPFNICGHRSVRATTCPGDRVATLLPTIRSYVQYELEHGLSGYWIVDRSGLIQRFGAVPYVGGPKKRFPTERSWVEVVGHPSGKGFWAMDDSGFVAEFGEAKHYGNLARGAGTAVGLASTPAGKGYWIATDDGKVVPFGRARSFGAVRAGSLAARIRGIVGTPTGKGYLLAAGDGGVFTFGDALFRGSAASVGLDSPVVGIARTPTGRGYWLATRAGRVIPFGDAEDLGSAGGRVAVRGIVATLTGKGYGLFRSDGSIVAKGDFPLHGDAAGVLRDTIGVGGRFAPTR